MRSSQICLYSVWEEGLVVIHVYISVSTILPYPDVTNLELERLEHSIDKFLRKRHATVFLKQKSRILYLESGQRRNMGNYQLYIL